MELLGYACAVLMGTVLGLIGGGGSILTVPILVYILSFDAVESTAYSLFIVGLASLVGAYQYYRRGLVNFRVGAVFAIPALVGVYSVRKFLVPWLPDVLFNNTALEVSKGSFILIVFSLVMLAAAVSMIRGRKEKDAQEKELNLPLIGIEGVLVGAVTGFVGAGGGFLVIPALVVLAGLEMKVAVGTSLMIIAVKSLIGFIGDVQVMASIDWTFLLIFSGLSIAGIFAGSYLSQKIPGQKLKPAFGWFVLAMGTIMISKEVWL